MPGFLRAALVLHRTYGKLPAGPRLHTLIRFLTCPFTRVLPYIPPSARTLLEIGGGHGVFARLAAERGLRTYVVEPDLRKTLLAPRLGGQTGVPVPHPQTAIPRFIAGFDDCIAGSFDVIAIMDVLYAIPIDAWDPLLSRIHARLPEGGTLLIKEQDPTARLKNSWNRAQEWVSERLLRITMAETFNYEAPETFVARLRRHGFGEVKTVRVDFGYPHPHLLYVAKR
ncbi:MAG TPA: class I SAM-dependent methyltransferase [Thermoanaerobaculia bacterium]|jgi:SAM-dependent methyltransferase